MHPFVVEEAVALTGMGLWGAEVDLAQDSWLSACRPALVLALTLQLQHWCLSLSLSQPLLPGAERQVQALLSRYGPGKLYQVTSNISGAGTLDLTLPRGHIVALLQNKDTKGNSSRWLVDTGGMWDFRGHFPALWEIHPTRASGETRVLLWVGSGCADPVWE